MIFLLSPWSCIWRIIMLFHHVICAISKVFTFLPQGSPPIMFLYTVNTFLMYNINMIPTHFPSEITRLSSNNQSKFRLPWPPQPQSDSPKKYVIKGLPLLTALTSLSFPLSFPYNFMHLIWYNLIVNLNPSVDSSNQGSWSHWSRLCTDAHSLAGNWWGNL